MPTTRDANGALHLGGIALDGLASDPAIGTPGYGYDLAAIGQEARDLRAAFDDEPHLVAYAVKANSAGPIVRTLAREACGADVVSGAELEGFANHLMSIFGPRDDDVAMLAVRRAGTPG